MSSSPSPSQTSPDLGAVRRTMRLSVLEGIPAMGFIVWTGGSALTAYALHLGATPVQLGLLGGLPLMMQVLAPIIAWLATRSGQRKRLALTTGLIGRGLWLLAPLVLLLPEEWRIWSLLLLIAVSNIFLNANGTLWWSWIADVVPEKERGQYFGFRGGLHGLVGLGVALLGGLMLDHLPAPLKFQVIFVLAVALGLVSCLLLALQWEPKYTPDRLKLGETFTAPLRDVDFRRFVGVAMYWTFGWQFAAPFMLAYFYKSLGLTFTQGAIYGAITAVLGMLLMPQWGRLADRVGHKPVFGIAAVGAGTILPLVWILAAPGAAWIVWLSSVFDTTASGAGGAALSNLALGKAPRERRAAYMAVLSVGTGVAGFTASVAAGSLVGMIDRWNLEVLGWRVTGFHVVFLVAALLRSQAWRLLVDLDESGAWRVRDVLNPRRIRAKLARA